MTRISPAPSGADQRWQSPVADQASLPVAGNTHGDIREVLDDGDGKVALYEWTGSAWIKIADPDFIDGSINANYRAVTSGSSPYSMMVNDYFLGVDTSEGTVTINLSTASAAKAGRIIVITDEGGNASVNAITVAASEGETINGSASFSLNTPRASVSLYSTGSSWFIY